MVWRPRPVEYKRGRRKPDTVDEVQLCAQAIALEEMTSLDVVNGSIYYGIERHRYSVAFTASLRQETADLAARVHVLLTSELLPPPVNDERCDQCSLRTICMPVVVGTRRGCRRWFEHEIERMEESECKNS